MHAILQVVQCTWEPDGSHPEAAAAIALGQAVQLVAVAPLQGHLSRHLDLLHAARQRLGAQIKGGRI